MNKVKVVLLTILVLAAAMSVMACANDGEPPELIAADYAAAQTPADSVQAVAYSAEPGRSVEMTAEDYLLQVLGATTILRNETAVDWTTTVTVGLDGTVPLTYESLTDILMELIGTGIADMPMPDFDWLLEEYSLQIIITMSADENLNIAYQIGLPTDNGGVVNIADILLIDGVLYMGFSLYLEIIGDLMSLVTQMLSEEELGLSGLEIIAFNAMLEAILDDVLGRFDGVDFVSFGTETFFEDLMRQSLEMQDDMAEIIDAFIAAIYEQASELFAEHMDIFSRDGDWYVIAFDEAKAQVLFETMLEILDENAEAATDALNQFAALLMDGEAFPPSELTVGEFREMLELYDPTIFDEFAGDFSLRARSGDETEEFEMTVVIAPTDEDFALRISMHSQISPRTQPLVAPDSAITFEEFMTIIGGIAQDFDLDFDLDEFMNDIDYLFSMMNTVHGPIAMLDGSSGQNVPTALPGTWNWDMDDSYTYVFNADGTGTRGFTGNIEPFEWVTEVGSHLIITVRGGAHESWTYAIVGDVLTIDSRQVPGMTFSYYRVG